MTSPSEESFRLLFESNPQPMWVYDIDSLAFLAVNRAAIEDYGWSREEFLGMRISDIRPPEEIPRLVENLGRVRSTREWSGPWTHTVKDGRRIKVEIISHELRFAGRSAALVVVRDITARLELEAQLRHQAFHDSLTGLANRVLFRDRLEHALARAGRARGSLAVVYIDLDDFKTVNDSQGHSIGDELLQAVAKRIGAPLRSGDTVARLGGDEFAILLEDIGSGEDAAAVAGRICNSLRAPVRLGAGEVHVVASAGVAVDGAGGEHAEELLRNADTAMYLAKSQNRGSYVLYEPSMHAALLERLQLEADLRSAIALHQLRLHYQPVVSLETEETVGFEALLRWEHPVRGTIPPLDFVPLAEHTGQIVAIGRWVLQEACAEARRLQDLRPDGPRLSMAVNVSVRQLRGTTLLGDVVGALNSSGLDPHSLILEITESALMDEVSSAVSVLRDLRGLGVRVAIDDFGTGYSSLSYLRQLPVDILKIDKSFVDGLEREPEASDLIRAIVRLGDTLHLDTIAEGIERPEQAERLRAMTCGLGQGFYFARPVPPSELEGDVTAGQRVSPKPAAR